MSTEEIQSIRDSLARIEKAITGDPTIGYTGIAGRLEKVERIAENHDRKLLTWGGIVLGIGVTFEHLKSKLFS